MLIILLLLLNYDVVVSNEIRNTTKNSQRQNKHHQVMYCKYMTIISVNMYKQFALMTQYIIMYTIDTSAQRSYLRITNYDNYWVVIEDNKDNIICVADWIE